MSKQFRPIMLPKTPAPDTFPTDSGKARDGGSGSSEPHQQVQYLNYKKGSTEVMVPNLLKRVLRSFIKHLCLCRRNHIFDPNEDAP